MIFGDCQKCRPVVTDEQTGQPLPDDSSEMRLISLVWDHTSDEERQAYHRVKCHNSRAPADLVRYEEINARIGNVMEAIMEAKALSRN